MIERKQPIPGDNPLNVPSKSITEKARQRVENIVLPSIRDAVIELFTTDKELAETDIAAIGSVTRVTGGRVACLWFDPAGDIKEILYWTPYRGQNGKLYGNEDIGNIVYNTDYTPSVVETERILGEEISNTELDKFQPVKNESMVPDVEMNDSENIANVVSGIPATEAAKRFIKQYPWSYQTRELLSYACINPEHVPKGQQIPPTRILKSIVIGTAGQLVLLWSEESKYKTKEMTSINHVTHLVCREKQAKRSGVGNSVNIETHDIRYFTTDNDRKAYSNPKRVRKLTRETNREIPTIAHVSVLNELSNESITPNILKQTESITVTK